MTDESPKESHVRDTPGKILESLCLIGVFIALFMMIWSALDVFSIPYGLDFGEGYLANMSLELVKGNDVYGPIDEAPYIVNSYPPLYPLVTGLITSITGPSMIPGRFISSISLMGILLMSFMLLRRMKTSLSVALIIPGVLLVFPWVLRWSVVVRVDTFGIFLALAGIYFWMRSGNIRDGIIASVLFGLAALTKHSLLSAPAACIIYALLTRDSRALTRIPVVIGMIALPYIIAGLITGGGIFRHLFEYTANAWFMDRFTMGFAEYVKSTWILQFMAIAAMITPGVTSGQKRLFTLYYMFTHLTLIAYGFEGSDTNYYIEPILSTALLSGLLLNYLIAEGSSLADTKTLPTGKTIGYGIILVVLIVGRFLNPLIESSAFQVHRMTPERLSRGIELIRLANATPGQILSEDASITFAAGKDVVFQPYIMSLLQRTGKWDQTDFVNTIRNREYSAILLRVNLEDPYNTEIPAPDLETAGFNRWTEEMERAILENYELAASADIGTILNSSRPLGYEHMMFVYLPRRDSSTDQIQSDPLSTQGG